MVNPYFEIGPFKIHYYGLIIAIAVYLGWFLAKKRAKIYKIPDKIFDEPILLLPLALGIVGGRLYHVLHYWDYYSLNLSQVPNISAGGLGIWGAILGIFLGLAIIAKVKKLNLLSVFDLAAPSVLLGQAMGRVGNFINQEGFGPPTDRPWAVYISPERRPDIFKDSQFFHPTFFYEAIIDLIFFTFLIYMEKRLSTRGRLFALYLILYSSGRFLVEYWRLDTWVISGVKVAQILSAFAFVLGIGLFLKIKYARSRARSQRLNNTDS